MSAHHPRLLLPIVLSGTFVQLFSVTVMQVAVPDVQRDLATGSGTGQLVLAGYTLTYACSLVVSARLGDRYGYRGMFVLGMALFTLASLGSAFAPSAWLLVAGRLAQGVGSGLMAPQTLSLIRSSVPPDRRAAALSAFGATMAAASMAGPVLGGVLIQFAPLGLGWRAAMLLTVPVGLAALALSPVLPASRGGADGDRVDPVGATLSLLGLGLLVLPLTVGRDAGWPPWTWASLVVAVVLLVGFALSQRRVPHPLVHPSTMSDPATRRGLGMVLVFNAGVPSFSLLLATHLQVAEGASPLRTGLTATPYAVGALVGSGMSAALSARFGRWALGGSSATLGLVCLAVAATIHEPALRWVLWLALGAGGFAFGAFTSSAFTRIIAEARPEAATSVSGLLPTAQQLGGTVGVTFAGMAYAVPASPGTALWHAMTYEVVVFALAALLAVVRAPRAADTSTARARTPSVPL
ncbi:MFS transporter [Umezawaea tangerina]|uniref:Putative MFS family arabinose efflux permease n=1 Tax=Umezawaea tangerina TaxID=84725 RepID=A0A2T0T256_9PSEU|nr:MFS transporter [Umezawaea tangerina]PRY39758.1 putative MFS family arabinose efflux permease [Umezawaea tangerina]